MYGQKIECLAWTSKTKKDIKQRCMLNPRLFNMYIVDLDSYLHKRGIEGISLGNVRIWSLAYADDVVLIAKNKEILINIMDILKLFLKEKALELNVSKKRLWFLTKKRKKEKR